MKLIILEEKEPHANFLRECGQCYFAEGCSVFKRPAEADAFIKKQSWSQAAIVAITLHSGEDRTAIGEKIEFAKTILQSTSARFYRVLFFYDLEIWTVEIMEKINDARPYLIHKWPADNEFWDTPNSAEASEYEYIFKAAAENLENFIEKSLDSLTGVLSKKEISQRMEVNFFMRKDVISLIFVDIDDLKKINDKYGHDIGDEVLKRIAFEIWGSLRPIDEIGRFGGDEFILCVNSSDSNTIGKICGRILEKIRSIKIIHKKGIICPTVSIGAMSYKHREFAPDADIREAIALADAALMEAKRLGKNRYYIAP